MKGNPAQGMGYLMQGFKLITLPKLRWFVIIPLILDALVFIALIQWSASLASGWIASLMEWLPAWLGFLDWLFWLVYGAVIVLVFVYGFVAIANIIGAPFYGYLSELTQRHLGDDLQEADEGWVGVLKSVPASLWREMQKQLYYLPRVVGLVILGFIPGINLIAGVLWFVFSAWMMALQYVDYPADNNKLSFPALRSRLGQQRLQALGFGFPIALASMIPLVNLIVIPAAVCGATAYWCEQRLGVGRRETEDPASCCG